MSWQLSAVRGGNNLWTSLGLFSLYCCFLHWVCFTSWSSGWCGYSGQQSSPWWDCRDFFLMQITMSLKLLASLQLRGGIKATFASCPELFCTEKSICGCYFLGISNWEKSHDQKTVKLRTALSMHFEVCTLVYRVPFQNVTLNKTQTSEKKWVFPQGSTLIQSWQWLTGVIGKHTFSNCLGWVLLRWKMSRLPEASWRNSIFKQKQHLKA